MQEIKRQTGAQGLIGYVVQIEENQARVLLDINDNHINRNNGLHGGIIATLLDAVSGYTASLQSEDGILQPVTTVSMTVNYVSRVGSGLVTGTAHVTGGGRKLVFVNAQLTAQDGSIVATAAGTFKRLKSTG